MKKLILIIASLFLATSIASASPSKQMDFASMNKADSQFLFDGSTNAIALSSQEMKQTEGEWIRIAIWAGMHAWNNRKYITRSWRYTVTYSGFGFYNNWR